MPNRIIKESSRTSETLDRLSAEAERLFWRLVTVADDHGRFEADPRILLAACFPLKVGILTPAKVEKWFEELIITGCVQKYVANGKHYGAFLAWEKHQRKRAEHSKYPAPPEGFNNTPQSHENLEQNPEKSLKGSSADNGGQMSANADNGGEMPPRVVFEKRETRNEKREAALTPELFVSLYHAAKPDECRRVDFITPQRRKKYVAYLKQFPDVSFWDQVFNELNLAPFLRGKRASPGRKPFRAGLDWLCEAKDGVENCIKVHEGFYREDEGHSPSPAVYSWQVDTDANPLSRDPER